MEPLPMTNTHSRGPVLMNTIPMDALPENHAVAVVDNAIAANKRPSQNNKINNDITNVLPKNACSDGRTSIPMDAL